MIDVHLLVRPAQRARGKGDRRIEETVTHHLKAIPVTVQSLGYRYILAMSRRKQGKHDEREENERQQRLEQKFIPSEDVPTDRHHPRGPIWQV